MAFGKNISHTVVSCSVDGFSLQESMGLVFLTKSFCCTRKESGLHYQGSLHTHQNVRHSDVDE